MVTQVKKNQQLLTRLQINQEASLLGFTLISGRSSAEEGCTDTNCLLENILNPLTIENEVALGWISSVSFLVDIEGHSDAELL